MVSSQLSWTLRACHYPQTKSYLLWFKQKIPIWGNTLIECHHYLKCAFSRHPTSGDVIGSPTPLIPRKLDPHKSRSSEKEEEETFWFSVKPKLQSWNRLKQSQFETNACWLLWKHLTVHVLVFFRPKDLGDNWFPIASCFDGLVNP